MGWKTEIAVRVPKFVLVNALGTVVDTAVLWALSEHVFHSYVGTYMLSPLISFEFAVFSNFCCSFFFIWKDRVEMDGIRLFFKKYIFYNLSCSMTFLLKMGFLLMFELLFGWNVVICNLAALCISGIINFSMGEWVVFRKRR